MISEAVELSVERIQEIVDSLKSGNYSCIQTGNFYSEKLSYIEVPECPFEGCSASFSVRSDSPTYGVPDVNTEYEIVVDGVTLIVVGGNGTIDNISVPENASYKLPSDGNSLGTLKKCICSVLFDKQDMKTASEENYDDSEDDDDYNSEEDYDYDSDPDVYEIFESEWTDSEVEQYIFEELSHDRYVVIDDVIYPVEDSIEKLIYDLCDGNEEEIKDINYKEISKREVAETLSRDIDAKI